MKVIQGISHLNSVKAPSFFFEAIVQKPTKRLKSANQKRICATYSTADLLKLKEQHCPFFGGAKSSHQGIICAVEGI